MICTNMSNLHHHIPRFEVPSVALKENLASVTLMPVRGALPALRASPLVEQCKPDFVMNRDHFLAEAG